MRVIAHAVIAFCLCITATFVIGCASATVSNETHGVPTGANPGTVYVGKFDLGEGALQSDPGTLTGRPRLFSLRPQDPASEADKLSDLLSDELVKDLNDANMPAQRLAADDPQPAAGWLVSGEFLEVTQGNRLQKAVIGFGAGNSDAQLYVTVADLSRPAGEDLLNFNVDSSGNKAPGGGVGAVVTHTPWAMAGKFVLDRNASEKDVKRAARQIADEIVKLPAKS